MSALILKWYDAGQEKTQTIYEQQPSKNPGTVRIGRDPLRCDIVLSHPTVSGLHVEIFFNPQQQRFLIRNLREQNPPVVDGKRLKRGEKPLNQGSVILLGQAHIQVAGVSTIEATVLSPPPEKLEQAVHLPPVAPQPAYKPAYGLECPRCHRVSPIEHLELGCKWCGTSLAAAASVLVTPNQ
ncbi:FHA domain-containing protein [Calothrix sp. UHCC 0171]|uniref:FHA domain-containing protein n=1 Tax=Calothrix sp. UHCC 0171 TaxID=3110245 RepID=UPI002B1EFD5B|nr:FHA domain-containing protein [Calothrix sp. UHCC 0171]MEA5571882.1 FHA domain-containing protein [Calothrix sp. UHCC 0171]